MKDNQTIFVIFAVVLLFIVWVIINYNRQYSVRVKTLEDDSEDDEYNFSILRKKDKKYIKCIPSTYTELGYLKNVDMNDADYIQIPLYGRRKTDQERWQYYTIYNKYVLPVTYKNKDCQHLLGCEFIQTGDEVSVPEYANKVFKAFMTVNYAC